MKYFLFSSVILFFLLLAGCSSEGTLPEGIIPDTAMSSIILEFTLIEAAYNTSLSDPGAVKFKPELFYEAVLRDRGYSRKQFIESIHYYTLHTKRLLGIYNRALEQLSEQQAKLSS
jgi:hypothetical protein